MNRKQLGGWLVTAFVAGCGAAAALPHLAVPPAAAADVQRWETMCVDADSAGVDDSWANDDLQKQKGWNGVLKAYGAEGWELVQLVTAGPTAAGPTPVIHAACFKRPK